MREPMDEGEIAQDYQSKLNQAGVEAVVARARKATGPSLEFCEECGDEISADRREKQPGCRLCVDCKRLEERLGGGL